MSICEEKPAVSAALAPPRLDLPAATLWLCPLAAAVVYYLCFFPVAAGWLAWVALVPLLVLVRLPGRPKRLYLACWAGSLVWHFAVLSWVPVADPMMYFAWVILAVYGSVYWPISLAVLRRLDQRTQLPLVVTVPAVWVSLEFVRYGLLGTFITMLGDHRHDVPGGFAWYMLGHTQHDFLHLIQVADVAGAFGVTALVAAVNALILEMLCGREWFRRILLGSDEARQSSKLAILLQGVGVAAALLLSLAYGTWQLSQPLDPNGPRLALMQTNAEQNRRNEAGSEGGKAIDAARDIEEEYCLLVDLARKQQADLVVSPETSLPRFWYEVPPGVPVQEYSQKLADDLVERAGAPILLGMTAIVGEPGQDKPVKYNSSILVGRHGRWLGRYDKIHRVPFGEYIPMRSALPFLSAFAPYDYEYEVAPGEAFTRFHLPDNGHTFGVLICYEDSVPQMARPYGGGGKAQTDFLVNVSNDGWFKGSSEHDQHLAICRFRAVECRRSVARAVNMGVSGIIDPCGRVLAPEPAKDVRDVRLWTIPDGTSESLPLSRWHEFKKAGGVVVGRVPLDSRRSWYAANGDWFAGACLGFAMLCFVGTFARRAGVPPAPHATC